MKEGIHPNYREVLFVDLSNGFKFVTRSCVNTKETETFEGRNILCSSWIPPLNRTPSTLAHKSRWTTWWPRGALPQPFRQDRSEVIRRNP